MLVPVEHGEDVHRCNGRMFTGVMVKARVRVKTRLGFSVECDLSGRPSHPHRSRLPWLPRWLCSEKLRRQRRVYLDPSPPSITYDSRICLHLLSQRGHTKQILV